MSREKLLESLAILKRYFRTTVPKGTLPQIVFHGAEPLLNREAVFAGIEQYSDDFRFGMQTNATLLDESAIEFLRGHEVSIGISLDAPTAAIADRTRSNWEGQGVFQQVVEAMDRLKGYPGWSVICTVSKENLRHLTKLVDFFHEHEVPTCLMNILRCTLPRSRSVKPDDAPAAKYFLQALDRTLRAVPEDRAQADRGQFRQHPAGHHRPGGAAADVRHLPLRRRPVLLRPGPQRRPVPVQRVHRPGRSSAAATCFATISRPCCRASRSKRSPAGRSRTSIPAAAAPSGTSAARPVRPRPTR